MLYARRVIEPSFFENKEGASVNINGVHQLTKLTNFFWRESDKMDSNNIYLRQGSVKYHIPLETRTNFYGLHGLSFSKG